VRGELVWAGIALCAFVCGCEDDPTVWRAELPSPNGAWLAIAHTEDFGGFGSAYIDTQVDLKRINGTVNRGTPFNVLDFDCERALPHPYVLDTANAGGTIDLRMRWIDSSHLAVTYNGAAVVLLQVVQFAGVSIALTDLSKASPRSPLTRPALTPRP
jgi:hypothetical protein